MDGKTKNRDLGITAELGRGAVILFVRYVKPKAVPACGESGCECNEQTKGLHRGCSCFRQPLSQTFGLPVPREGEPFGDGANSNHQPALKGEVGFAKQKPEGL